MWQMDESTGHSEFTVKLVDTDFVGAIVFILSFVGLVCNVVVAVFMTRLPSLNNAFGRLMASQAAGEAIICALMNFYVAPMVFFQITSIEQFSIRVGLLGAIGYDVCIWSHLFVALNRMCAICFPFDYDRYFRNRNIKILIFLSWFIPIATAVSLYVLHDCNLYFNTTFWAFVFIRNDICDFISGTIDYYKDLILICLIALMDTITIIMVRVTQKNVRDVNQETRRRKEINFLKQAVFQGVAFVLELYTYFIFAWKFTNRWAIFGFTTVAWILVHTADPIIVLILNKEFRSLIAKPLVQLNALLTNHVFLPMNSSTAQTRAIDVFSTKLRTKASTHTRSIDRSSTAATSRGRGTTN